MARNFMNQGDIWLVNLNPNIGAEIHKVRPVIIVSSNQVGKLPLKIIVPINEWKSNFSLSPWMVMLLPDDSNNLTKISAADTFQIRSISEERFIRKLGEIDSDIIEFIKNRLSLVLDIIY